MKTWFNNIYHFFPVQLFVLHFRKYQVLLLFWYVLFSTINSGFMKSYGADALFFAPEYLGEVNVLGAFITGIALAIFIMSWNITTFILHSRRFKFLATTTNPFLKYCINNFGLPFIFIIFYFIQLVRFDDYRELMPFKQIFGIALGILLGFIALVLVSFAYFFGAGRTISSRMSAIINNPELFNKKFMGKQIADDHFGLKVNTFLTTGFRLKKIRSVSHYREDFIDAIFKRHHLAAIASILMALVFLVIVGFFLDQPLFEMPAAASIFIFFSLMVALIGALSYFLQSWSLPFAIILLLFFNWLFENEYIDPRNKAYGLEYSKKNIRPEYNAASLNTLCSPAQVDADKKNMLQVLNRWKNKQASEKPVMVFINVSGGGLRSSAFTMYAMQQLDSMMHGSLMQQTFLISGASGGMLSAAYYRELYRQKLKNGPLNLYDHRYVDAITGDLLNPIFSSMMARDLMASTQKFKVGDYKYLKDRGYAFEKKLGQNTDGLLDIQLKDVVKDESSALVPLIFFSSVIKNDGRKMILSTQPVSFMMRPNQLQQDSASTPDAVDFAALFKNQQPMNLRMLTALRMNATFPYVLPNVWLPSNPVIDVMDAGLRDNYGQETTLRFIDNFKDWIRDSTGGVLIVQIRDRSNDNWNAPFETKSATDVVVTPATMLQHNWFKLQDYFQASEYAYYKNLSGNRLQKINIMYLPEKPDKKAALNFHLTAREKRDIRESFRSTKMQQLLKQISNLAKPL